MPVVRVAVDDFCTQVLCGQVICGQVLLQLTRGAKASRRHPEPTPIAGTFCRFQRFDLRQNPVVATGRGDARRTSHEYQENFSAVTRLSQ